MDVKPHWDQHSEWNRVFVRSADLAGANASIVVPDPNDGLGDSIVHVLGSLINPIERLPSSWRIRTECVD